MTPKTILFVGGGSLGHVAPCVAVASVVGTRAPVRTVFVCADREEETAFLAHAKVPFHTLRAPKFPRMMSFAALAFPFTFFIAFWQAKKIIETESPDLVFSKGGYVSVPVCLVAKWKNIPIVLHESDSVMGMSTLLIAKWARTICTGFKDIAVPSSIASKVVHTGNPVRAVVAHGSESAGQRITGFSGRRPVVMIIGGSQGSLAINQAVEKSLGALIDLADIIHLTGKGKEIPVSHARYFARPTVIEELPHLYALSDLIISRSGAGVLSELAMLRKPVITIPLEGVAHDHQVKNAEALVALNAVVLLEQEELQTLAECVRELLSDDAKRTSLGLSLAAAFPVDASERIAAILLAPASDSSIQS